MQLALSARVRSLPARCYHALTPRSRCCRMGMPLIRCDRSMAELLTILVPIIEKNFTNLKLPDIHEDVEVPVIGKVLFRVFDRSLLARLLVAVLCLWLFVK